MVKTSASKGCDASFKVGGTLNTDQLKWPFAESQIPDDWRELVQAFAWSEKGQALRQKLEYERQNGALIYPPYPLRALSLTPLNRVRVVIVGQDPYHQAGQANGLAFSVGLNQKRPPSLRKILQEVERDQGATQILDGQLEPWARQGVLMINRVLTVRDSQPACHANWGWEAFTDEVLRAVNELKHPVAFLLWGAHAQKLVELIDERRHCIWRANHPSPLSARRGSTPFVGCGHFSAVNAWLRERGEAEISW